MPDHKENTVSKNKGQKFHVLVNLEHEIDMLSEKGTRYLFAMKDLVNTTAVNAPLCRGGMS